MKAVIQRVSNACVIIRGQEYSAINQGLLIFIGIGEDDVQDDINWLVSKIIHLRIFNDHNGVMNCSVLENEGELLVISQFTLHASTRKGNRPSYIRAARPELALPVYHKFLDTLRSNYTLAVKTGEFGADMKIKLTNDGPVTIIIDTKNRE